MEQGESITLISGIFRLFARICSMDGTIAPVEQSTRMALKLSDRGCVIGSGKIVPADTADDLTHPETLIKAHT